MKKYILLLLISLKVTSVLAQNFYDSITYEDVKRVVKTYDQRAKNDQLLSIPLEALLNLQTSSYQDYRSDILTQRIKQLNGDIGLTFSATAQENLDDGFDEASQNFTKTRLTAGLDWHLLSGGFYQNRLQSRIKKNELKLMALDERTKTKENNYYLLYNLFIFWHNQKKLDLLDKRSVLLEEITTFYRDLHSKHLIDRKALMNVTDNLNEANLTYESYKAYNNAVLTDLSIVDSLRNLSQKEWPVYQIDLEKLLRIEKEDSFGNLAVRIQQENLIYQQRANREIQFKLFVRYSLNRSRIAETTRKYPTIGASLQLPINFKGGNQELYEYRATEIEETEAQMNANLSKELMNHFYEYQYALKQYAQFKAKQSFYDYAIKLDSMKLSYDFYLISPLQLLDHMTARSTVELEILDLKQKLSLKLLKIFTLSSATTPLDFIRPLDSEERHAFKSLVINDKQNKDPFLEAYITLNDIDEIVESVSNTDYDEKTVVLTVTDYPDKRTFDKVLRLTEQSGVVDHIIIDRWETLLKLEMSTLNN